MITESDGSIPGIDSKVTYKITTSNPTIPGEFFFGSAVYIGGGYFLTAGHVITSGFLERQFDNLIATFSEEIDDQELRASLNEEFILNQNIWNLGNWGGNGEETDIALLKPSTLINFDESISLSPLIVFQNPDNAFGSMATFGYPAEGGFDGSTFTESSGFLYENQYDSAIVLGHIWNAWDVSELENVGGNSGGGVWLTFDAAGNGTSDRYLAGILSGQNLGAAIVSVIGDVYQELANILDQSGSASDYAANTIVADLSTPDAQTILGTFFNENIYGSYSPDTIFAGDGDDSIFGRGNSDQLYGGLGNDILQGGDGRDELQGGDGIDTAVFEYDRIFYTVAPPLDSGETVVFRADGDTDILYSIERLQFADVTTDIFGNPIGGVDASGVSLISGLGGTAGFGENLLARNDDGSTGAIDITSIFEDGLNFFGREFTQLWVNNNGSVTFNGARSTFTPTAITEVSGNPEISPYFADVDTRGGAVSETPGGNSTGSNLVYYDFDTDNDRFIVTWDDVGYYSSATDKLNAFQLILSDRGNGDFDIEFRYEEVNWTTGDASGGTGGLGGVVARAGYTAGTGDPDAYFELPASGDQGDMLALDETEGNTGDVGRWLFRVRSGDVETADIPPLPPIGPTGWMAGDPHLATLDGVGYDFQAVGEYVLMRGVSDPSFEVQARFVPIGNDVSVTSAIATNLGGTALMVDATDATPVTIGGVATAIDDFSFVEVGNDRIFREDNTYTIVYAGADGIVNAGDSRLIVDVVGDRVDLEVRLNTELAGDLEGLLGDGDGDASNDIALADGTVLDRPLAFDDLYGQYRDDWRVSDEADSLFTYDDGESLAGFYDPDYPGSLVTLDDLDPGIRAAAEQAATDAGLTPGTANFNNAVLDFALTGDPTFIQSSLNAPAISASDFVPTEEPTFNVVNGTSGRDILTGTGGADEFRFNGGYGDVGTGNGGDDVFDFAVNVANGAVDNTRIVDWSDGDMIIGFGIDDIHMETVRSSSTALRFAYGPDNDVLTITGDVSAGVESLFELNIV